MSAGIGKAVGDYLAGNLAVQRALHDLRSGAMPDQDALYRVVRDASPEFASDWMRGFLRGLQKAIEQEAAHG